MWPMKILICTCTCLKINGYSSKGSDSAIFMFASLYSRCQLLKGRICFSRSKFFPLRFDFNLERLYSAVNRKSQKLFLCLNIVEKQRCTY